MLPVTKQIGIDDSVAIPCPKRQFKPALAAESCPKCEYFEGVAILSTDMRLAWYQRYCIRCAHPIERRTKPIKFEIDPKHIRDIKINEG